jgi:hypothetical protein
MDPAARELLVSFYKPYNKRLADLLDDPGLEVWNQQSQ